MSNKITLKNLAIKYAKKNNWEEAVKVNQELLELNPEDTNALNRLGVALIQLDNIKEAKKAFKKTLELDVNNRIAQKHLEKLKNNQTIAIPSFSRQHFIEEPGKTKTVSLLRLTNKQVLENISVGQDCELKIKNRFISIESNDKYLGTLPEDLSFRLSKLIKSGNKYSCQIRMCSAKQCSVYLKEITRSPKNQGTQSFPPKDIVLNPLSEINETIVLEENIPVEIVQTDFDTEKTLEDINTDEVVKNN